GDSHHDPDERRTDLYSRGSAPSGSVSTAPQYDGVGGDFECWRIYRICQKEQRIRAPNGSGSHASEVAIQLQGCDQRRTPGTKYSTKDWRYDRCAVRSVSMWRQTPLIKLSALAIALVSPICFGYAQSANDEANTPLTPFAPENLLKPGESSVIPYSVPETGSL